MPRREIALEREKVARLKLQKEIRATFGEVFIQKARKRLCFKCKNRGCFLLPITSDGKDCPFFKEEVAEK